MLDDRTTENTNGSPTTSNCSQLEVVTLEDGGEIARRGGQNELIINNTNASSTTIAASNNVQSNSVDIDMSLIMDKTTLITEDGSNISSVIQNSVNSRADVEIAEISRQNEEEKVSSPALILSEQQQQQAPYTPSLLTCRAERSNSCSQAELGAAVQSMGELVKTAGFVSNVSTCSLIDTSSLLEIESFSHHQQQQQQILSNVITTTTSASQINLALSTSQNNISDSNNNNNNKLPTISSSASTSDLINLQIVNDNIENDGGKNFSIIDNNQSKQQQQQQKQQQQQQQLNIDQQTSQSSINPNSSNKSSASSRFFSSKLNTGSLWSLLSVGSNSSYCSIDQSLNNLNDNNNIMDANLIDNNQSSNDTTVGSFFSRVQKFKRNSSNASQDNNSSVQQKPQSDFDKLEKLSPNRKTTINGAGFNKRVRFNNIKYIGSTILHKNFTLPMLEWIAKDIKRQTIKGAQLISQRQFNIPSKEIIFEIQSNLLTAISCKDGQPIFIHPMHCISKYVQLQHDQACFSYFIRDNKGSPYYCHVFKAKNALKVHDIFQAIREATTTTAAAAATLQQQQQQQTSSTSLINNKQKQVNNNNLVNLISPFNLQKSFSSDGSSSSTSLMNDNATKAGHQSPNCIKIPTTTGIATPTTFKGTTTTTNSNNFVLNNNYQVAHQFEDSYQFEVMFVKKVKLQCRRVPASFVDDALETLKSFEVLKGGIESKANQIKGSIVGKRIISASVDERQEYDEACQSPTPQNVDSTKSTRTNLTRIINENKTIESKLLTSKIDDEKSAKGSSVSLNKLGENDDKNNNNNNNNFSNDSKRSSIKFENNNNQNQNQNLESRSCQQSPTKLDNHYNNEKGADNNNSNNIDNDNNNNKPANSIREQIINMKKHQSMDCLKNLTDLSIKSAKAGNTPNYTNDFSPYSTITSNDLNERIAAIPVVSTSSVSLDHETRQKLARQVRETIMATAANIKKDVYASGDKLDSSSSSKALDSLSCTVTSSVPPVYNTDEEIDSNSIIVNGNINYLEDKNKNYWSLMSAEQRRSSIGSGKTNNINDNNNFDLFRRASARQVVKNRTMLLLIGKDELCTISIDKHQMLFSKSFSSIVLCLQGNNNKDHFGLICRDSGKINPQTESYAGFIFKCQSDKVAREIMGALKQVIYNSQHNLYHGLTSPYNPLNTSKQQQISSSLATAKTDNKQMVSLATKRGFLNSIDLDEAARQSMALESTLSISTSTTPPTSSLSYPFNQQQQQPSLVTPTPTTTTTTNSAANSPAIHYCQQQPKNSIKSMFCDNCPLYWYHRLCCDIESLPADASKTIILRRIDTSLPDKEQDEIYSKFSEFNIETIDEHNEIFMSLLRHLSERKQLKHNQSLSHQNAMAKNLALLKQQQQQQQTLSTLTSNVNVPQNNSFIQSSTIPTPTINDVGDASSTINNNRNHHRSGSSSGSLAFILKQQQQQATSSSSNQQSSSIVVDASSTAIDNLKKAKNSISISIENMLKKRSSLKDDNIGNELEIISDNNDSSGIRQPVRGGSFKTPKSNYKLINDSIDNEKNTNNSMIHQSSTSLKRSQSTTDYSNSRTNNSGLITAANNNNSSSFYSTATFNLGNNWKNSLVSRTIDNYREDLSSNPIVGLFRRRGSSFGSKNGDLNANNDGDSMSNNNSSQRTSTDCLAGIGLNNNENSPFKQQNSPTITTNRFMFQNSTIINNNNNICGSSSPSSMLSSAFWKKSIFDKIRQPNVETSSSELNQQKHHQIENQQEEQQQTISSKSDNIKLEQDSSNLNLNKKRTSEDLRALWRKAILEQITLIKMDKQNQRLLANAVHCDTQRIKLNYRDIPYNRDVLNFWDKLLKQDPTIKVEFVEVARLIRAGLPKQRRGEIWMFLMNQYQLRHGTCFQPADSEFKGDANQAYRSLLSQLSLQQHEIFVDIGRTFPTHPYYSQYLSIGQLSLFNLLKAYSLLDQEVGYCQGLSFVAGILLLHVNSEDEAFELMRHLLFNFGLRKQYLPSMNALHLQLYQITRLLRDFEFELFDHFDKYDISPSLYAAPWFLTIFASQFPLSFVSRLLDLVFLIGIEAIFRVSLNLLTYHKDGILKCQSLESTMDYMRYELIKIVDDKNLIKLFDKSMSLDLRNKLIEYEIEYTFYCAEDKARSSTNSNNFNRSYSKSSSTSTINNNNNRRAINSNSIDNNSKNYLIKGENNDKREQEKLDDKIENNSESKGKIFEIKDEEENINGDNYNLSDNKEDDDKLDSSSNESSTSVVADATATVIIQHLLANNHLKSLRTNYSY